MIDISKPVYVPAGWQLHAWGQFSLLRPCAGVKLSSQQPNVEFKQLEIDIQVDDMQIMFSPKQSEVFSQLNGLVGTNWGPLELNNFMRPKSYFVNEKR